MHICTSRGYAFVSHVLCNCACAYAAVTGIAKAVTAELTEQDRRSIRPTDESGTAYDAYWDTTARLSVRRLLCVRMREIICADESEPTGAGVDAGDKVV